MGHAYVRFSEEGDPNYLGVALVDENWFSRLLFSWVNPLMEKGIQGQLKNSEDLYDLPISLNSGAVNSKLVKYLIGYVDIVKPCRISSTTSLQNTVDNLDVKLVEKTTLLKGLHNCFWIQFYSIGALKLLGDCAGFAGPLLLNRLIIFLDDKSEDVKWGYLYAFLLMSTTLLGEYYF